MRTFRLDLPIENPMNLNHRQHYMVAAKQRAEIVNITIWMCRAYKIPPMRKIKVTMHYIPKVNRRRDDDNLVATMKPLVDGLVKAGVIPDDTREYVERSMPVIDPKDRAATRRIYVIIEELA